MVGISTHDGRFTISAHLCVPTEQERHLPARRRAPRVLPAEAPLPRSGEIIYLSSSSAWVVTTIVHEWRSPRDLRIEVWLEYAGSSRAKRTHGFTVTQ